MKRIISLLVVMAMMLASVLAIIPVAATTSIENNDDVVVDNSANADGDATEAPSTEVTRFLPDGVMDKITAVFEADGAATSRYQPKNTAPFVNYNADAQNMFGGKRLLKIWAPIKETGAVDENGDLHFTLAIATIADLKAAAVAEYIIKVDSEEYGLTPNTQNVHKVIEVDLTSYNIVIAKGQTLVIGGDDTAWLAWESNQNGAINTILKADAPYAVDFSPSATNSGYKGEHWGTSIFYDIAMVDADANLADVDVSAYGIPVSSVDEFKNMKVGKNYYLTTDLTLPADYSPVAFSNGTFDGAGHKITLATTDGLFKHVDNATFKNFVLEGPASSRGVVNSFSGSITFDNVDVKLAAITAGDISPYVPAAWSGSFSFVFKNCDNYTPMNVASGSAAAFVAGSNTSGTITIEKCNNYASMKGKSQTGGFLGHTWTGGIIIKDSNNGSADAAIAIESTENNAGGFLGTGKGNVTVVNSKNYATVKSGTTSAGGFSGQYPSSGEKWIVSVDGFENYGKVTSGNGQNAGGVFAAVASSCTLEIKNAKNYGEIVGSLTGGGIVGWANGIPSMALTNVENYANVTARYVGGIVGASHTTATIKNAINGSADKAIAISGNEFVGGLIGNARATTIDGAKNYATVNQTNNDSTTVPAGGILGYATGAINLKNVTNYGETKANQSWSGGIVAWADNVTFVGENLTNAGKVNSKGTWKTSCGGIIGTVTNAASTVWMKNCVNEAGAFPNVNDNRGGMIGSSMNNGDGENFHVLTKVTFINCVNKADISANGNIGGFVGQFRCKELIFEGCSNYGNVTSYGNMPGGYAGWNGGSGTMTFTECYNYGNITAQKENKGAAGFISGTSGYTSTLTDCINYGTIKATGNNGTASGFATDGGNIQLIRSYNVGSISGTKATNEYCTGIPNLVDCIKTGLHADIIAKVKTLPLYKDVVAKASYMKIVDAVNAATEVYNTADATAEQKAAALAAIDKAYSNLVTWIEVSPDVTAIGGSIIVKGESVNAEGKDWVGLVKDGDTVATVWAYLTDIQAAENGFNILEGTLGEGKTIVEGDYTLYLVPNDATIEQVLAGEVEALATADVIISGKAITTAEQFVAMDPAGEYILGADITLPANYVAPTFKGTLDGHGHTITLTGADGLFYKLEGATIKNLNVTATAKLRTGLTHLVAGTVNFNNVSVNAMIDTWWASSDYDGQVGGFVDKVNDANVVLNFVDCTSKVSVARVSGNAGGFIGEVGNVGQINMTNCVSATSKNATTVVSNSTWQDGQAAGGFFGRIGNGTATFTNCVNNAKVYGPSAQKDGSTMRENAGGYIGIVAGSAKVNFIDCVNNGEIGTTASGRAGGFVGAYTSANTTSKVAFDGCLNTANITSANSAGGFIGYANGVVTVTNSQNGSKKNDITIAGNGGSNAEGTAGFAGFLSGQITIYDNTEDGSGFGFKNYALIKPNGNHSAAGIIALFANGSNGAATVFRGTEVYNYGDIDTWDGWHYGDGGMIANGKWRDNTEIYFVDSENHGNVLYSNNSNKAGFVGYAERGNVYSFINCKNYGNVDAAGNASGFVGQVKVVENGVADGINNIYFENCENHGNITTTLGASGFIGGYAHVDNSFIIKDCANYGRIQSTGNNAAAGFTVDLKGEGTKVYTNCVNYGTIISANTAASLIAWIGNKTTLENCDNYGQIISLNGKGYAFHDGAPTMDDACENNGYVIDLNDSSTFQPIWTAEDFMNMDPAGCYILMDNIVLPEDYKAMVYGTTLYNGATIDGNGKTIYMKGLTAALFHEVYGATLKNFTIVGTLTFNGDGAALIQNYLEGDLTIENVILDVDVTATKTAAGFIRWSRTNQSKNLTIKDSKFLGNVTGGSYASAVFGGSLKGTINLENVIVGSKNEKTTITGKNRVGAFFAETYGPNFTDVATNVVNIVDCANYADILQNSNGNEGCAGALAGRLGKATFNVDGFVNYGNVKSLRTTGWWQGVGAIVGEINQNAYLNLDYVLNYGDVETNKSTIGGIVGLVSNRSYLVIDNTVNYGDVKLTATSWTYGVGGFVGGIKYTHFSADEAFLASPINSVEIYNSINYGDVSTTVTNVAGFIGFTEPAGGGDQDKGGLAKGAQEADLIRVQNCVNYGTVSAGGNCAAGIVGQLGANTLEIIDCSNYGTVTSKGGAAGIASFFWSGAMTNLTVTGNANYGTITSTGNDASGILVNTNVNADGTGIISDNCNYGIIIGAAGKACAAIVPGFENIDEFLGNANYGVLASANAKQSPAVTETDAIEAVYAGGVALTDADLIAVAKALKPVWHYSEADWFGVEEEEPETPVEPETPAEPESSEEEATVAPNNDGETVAKVGILQALIAAQAVNDNVAAANALVEALTADAEEAEATFKAAADALQAAKDAVANASSEEIEAATEALLEANQAYGAALLNKTEISTALVTATKTAEDLTATQEEDRAAAVETLTTTVDNAIEYTEFYEYAFDYAKSGADLELDEEVIAEVLEKMESAESQEDFDAAFGEFKEVIASTIDYSALLEQYDRYMNLDFDDYTDASIRNIYDVFAKYSDIEEEDITQAIVDAFAADLKAALDALRDNYYIVEDALAFLAYVDTLNPDDYTEATWAFVVENYDILAMYLEWEDDPDQLDYIEEGVFYLEYALASLITVADLEALLAEIETLDADNYTKFSWLAISSAVSKATAVLSAAESETADKETADANIADAIAYVTAAIEGLVDISELKANIADAKAEAEGGYTVETLAALNAAIAKAEVVLATAKTAEEVEAANELLVDAIDALEVRVDVNTGMLSNSIKAVEVLNAADYTAATWAAVKEALAAAKIALYAATQEEVDAARAALDDAKAALVVKPTTEALAGVIAEVEALVAGDYTAETWAALAEALAAAKAALASDAQADIDEAKAALDAAKAALAAKVAADNSALSALIAEIEALKSADYTSDSWATLKTALDAAKAVLESDDQNAIDVAKAALDAAKAGLTKVVVETPVVDDEDEDENDETDKPETTEPTTQKKGCASVIGATAVVLTAVLGLGATVVLKKKED